MTFLNPTALIALLAAALPVIIHLLNLRKLKKVEISSLTFLKELQKTKIKRIKIKQWILLALRILIIMFLVIAFSKPAARSINGFASGAKTTAVIIIDNSFSMSVVDAGGSYFNQAKEAAQKLLNSFNSGDEVSLLFTCTIEDQNTAAITDFYKLKKKIEDGQISSISIPLMNLLPQVKSILTDSRNVNKEVYIISDFQKNRITSAGNKEELKREVFNEYARVYFLDVPSKKTSNLSVTGLTADNQIFEAGKTVSFTSLISNYSAGNIDNAVASLFINGKRTAQQGINLRPGETRQINFETTLNETGFLNISVELEDDDIPADNKRFMCLYVPEKINIAAFSDLPDDLNYVMLAIEAAETKSISVSQKSTSQINSTDLSNYDLVILCGTESVADYKPVQNYLAARGNILFFPGSRTTLANYNKFCYALNLPRGESIIKNTEQSAAGFDKVEYRHPVLTGIFEKKEQLKISSPSFYTYIKTASGSGRNIFGLTGGTSFLTEYNSTRGKVLQFSSAPTLSAGDFPAKAIFAPLIQKCISYLAVKFSESGEKLAGEAITIKQEYPGAKIKAELPNKENIIINEENRNADASVLFAKTAQTGIYKFFSGDKLIDFSSLNFDSKESVLERIKLSDLEENFKKEMTKSSFYSFDTKKDLKTEIEMSRFGVELWIHALVIALLLAIAEMYISKTSKNDLTEIRKT